MIYYLFSVIFLKIKSTPPLLPPTSIANLKNAVADWLEILSVETTIFLKDLFAIAVFVPFRYCGTSLNELTLISSKTNKRTKWKHLIMLSYSYFLDIRAWKVKMNKHVIKYIKISKINKKLSKKKNDSTIFIIFIVLTYSFYASFSSFSQRW